MQITYQNSVDQITIEDAIYLYEKHGICTQVNNGRDITFVKKSEEEE